MPDEFFHYLSRSIAVLREEAPREYAAMAAALDGTVARLMSNGDARAVRFDRSRFLMDEPAMPADVEAVFDRAVILDLVEGSLSLEEAVLAERLWIRGKVEAVERLYDGLCIYLDAAVRVDALAELLERYRGQ